MLIKQISVFIENKPGRLAGVTKCLADENLNIHALSIADTTDFGILRIIADDSDKALEALKRNNLTVKITEVIAVALEHKPGSLAKVLAELDKAGVSIEYMYAFTSRSSVHDAMVILRLGNQEESLERIKNCDIQVLGAEALKNLNGGSE